MESLHFYGVEAKLEDALGITLDATEYAEVRTFRQMADNACRLLNID